MKENELVKKIERRFRGTASGALRLAMGDDAALLTPTARCELVLTCDWFLEGSHFLLGKSSADSVGWKCLARAASDIAAMGGRPRCFLLSLALPANATGKWLNGFLKGLGRAAKELNCELAGGDTAPRDEILIGVTVVGEIRKGLAVGRGGARPGDQLFVTGVLGEADLGLRMLQQEKERAHAKNSALRKHLYPIPRMAVGQWLAEKKLASAMMDLSDGLSTDLERLCVASGVGARIEGKGLPMSQLAECGDLPELALHGGDDYELLFAVRPKNAKRIPSKYCGVSLTRIGEITAERKILVEQFGKTRALLSKGWDPFRNVHDKAPKKRKR